MLSEIDSFAHVKECKEEKLIADYPQIGRLFIEERLIQSELLSFD